MAPRRSSVRSAGLSQKGLDEHRWFWTNPHRSPGAEPVEAPRLTREWFERADLNHGDKLVRRGRPKSVNPKEAVNLRLDADVLEYFRKAGPGWQTRINEALRKAAGLQRSTLGARTQRSPNGGHRPFKMRLSYFDKTSS